MIAILEPGTLQSEPGATTTYVAPVIWLPTSVALSNPQATATLKVKTLAATMQATVPAGALSAAAQPTAVLDPHETSVTPDG